tara:strand:+ start:143 stop:520 length:378 start_codon:yes stop_codon:yes gene_type:complete
MRRLIITIGILALCLFPILTLAQIDPSATGLVETAQEAGYVEADNPPTLTGFIATIVNVVLGLTGVALLVLLIYGGIRWMTAMGNKDAVDAAKKILTNSIIGIIIVVAAYAIANYIILALIEAAT